MNEDGGDEQKKENTDFTKPRDLRRLYSKVHPDRFMAHQGPDSPYFWGSELMNILNELASSDQLENWPPALRVKILRREHSGVKFVRSFKDGAEVSELVKLPPKPRQFLRALEAYTLGKPWEEVMQLLNARLERSSRSQHLESLELQIASIQSFEDAGKAAKVLNTAIEHPHERRMLMGLLMSVMGNFLTEKSLKCSDLQSLRRLHEKTIAFFRTEGGSHFRQVTLMDILDSRALHIGKELLMQALTKEQVADAMAEIKTYPFEFPFVYDQSFSESKEDTIARIDFLTKLRAKRTEKGLNDLREEVEAFKFQSADKAEIYRHQILDYIERKRQVYWPKIIRRNMPKA